MTEIEKLREENETLKEENETLKESFKKSVQVMEEQIDENIHLRKNQY